MLVDLAIKKFRQHTRVQASGKYSNVEDNSQFVMKEFTFDIRLEKRTSECHLSQSLTNQLLLENTVKSHGFESRDAQTIFRFQ